MAPDIAATRKGGGVYSALALRQLPVGHDRRRETPQMLLRPETATSNLFVGSLNEMVALAALEAHRSNQSILGDKPKEDGICRSR